MTAGLCNINGAIRELAGALVQYQRGHHARRQLALGSQLIAGRPPRCGETRRSTESSRRARSGTALWRSTGASRTRWQPRWLRSVGRAPGQPRWLRSVRRRPESPPRSSRATPAPANRTSSTCSSPRRRGGSCASPSWRSVQPKSLRSRPARFAPTSPSRTPRCTILAPAASAARRAVRWRARSRIWRASTATPSTTSSCAAARSPRRWCLRRRCSAPTTRWRRRLNWHRSSPLSTRRWRRGTSRRPPRSGKRASSCAAPTSRCSTSEATSETSRLRRIFGVWWTRSSRASSACGPARRPQSSTSCSAAAASTSRAQRRSIRAWRTPTTRRARSSPSAATTVGSRRRPPSPTAACSSTSCLRCSSRSEVVSSFG